jgi:DNA-binding transcriptional regulator YhcF (GntR family)
MAKGKYQVLAERLSRRIRAGDYHLQPLPAERELATEVGVSHMTARKAIQQLLEEGLLCRQENGRLAVRQPEETDRSVQRQIVMLAPAWESMETTRWQIALTRMAARFHCLLRIVYYSHWDDPLLFGSLEGFDGAFLMPLADAMPRFFLDRFLTVRRPIVVLGADWTEHGIPSLRLYPPTCVHRVLDHLESLGHRSIDFFNIQPLDSIVEARISQWQLWSAARGSKGELIDRPVKPFTETISAAYEVIAQLIHQKQFNSKAMLCIHERVAAGAMRAMLDFGIRPGYDVAVATIDPASRAEYEIPSLTSLEVPDPHPYLSVCLEWMLSGSTRQWRGPLMVQPEEIRLVVRESTVPGVDEQTRPERMRRALGPTVASWDAPQPTQG